MRKVTLNRARTCVLPGKSRVRYHCAIRVSFFFKGYSEQGSNLCPPGSEPGALPLRHQSTFILSPLIIGGIYLFYFFA